MCSQTNFGRVNMNVYETGRKLQEFIYSGSDMTAAQTQSEMLPCEVDGYEDACEDGYEFSEV